MNEKNRLFLYKTWNIWRIESKTIFFRELSTPLVPDPIMDEFLKIKVDFDDKKDQKEFARSIDAFKMALSHMNIPSRFLSSKSFSAGP